MAVTLCECGCGQPAPIAARTNTKFGHIKGEPTRFIRGHYRHIQAIKLIPLEERFWSKVNKTDDCWLWTGAHSRYGHIKVVGQGLRRAHKVSYELCKGPIPPGAHVLHTCDNGLCVKPDHLFLGSHAENMADKAQKGRAPSAQGEASKVAKLTEAKVQEIRRLSSQGVPYPQIGRAFGVTATTVCSIVKRHTWKHVL